MFKTDSKTSGSTLSFAEAVTGIGAFELDLVSKEIQFTRQLPALFGLDSASAPTDFQEWERVIFVDDTPKVRAALEAAIQSGSYYVEFRVKHADGKLRWLAGKGQLVAAELGAGPVLRGAYYDIGERKQLEAKLLSVNETLEARIDDLREEARTLEVLNRTGITIASELDLERLLHSVTDAGRELSGAAFGAFFYNVVRPDGESRMPYTLSGASRDDFAGFPMPRNTPLFEPTFRGLGNVRSADILAYPRYGKTPPIMERRPVILQCACWQCLSRRSRASSRRIVFRTSPARNFYGNGPNALS